MILEQQKYIYKNNKFQDHIFFALFESDPDDSAMRNAVDALFPDPNKVNVSLGGGRGSKRGSCVKKIQAFSFLNKWNQIGVFFAWGVFLGRNGSCFIFPPAVWFLLGMDPWDM